MKNPDRASRVIFPAGLAACLSLLGDLSLFVVLVTQLDVVHISMADLGILLSIHRFVRLPGNPLAGFLMDHFGRRRLFLLGVVFAVLSTAAYGIVSGFWLFLLSRVLWGCAWALINIGGLNMVMDLSTDMTRGRLSGIFNAWVLAGYAVGPLTGGLLVDRIGFRPAMLVCAALTALGLLAGLLWLRETLPVKRSSPPPRMAISGMARRWQGLFIRLAGVLRTNRRAGLAMLLQAIARFIEDGVILSTVTLLLTSLFGSTLSVGTLVVGVVTASGVLIAMRSILAGICAPVAGRLSDLRFGRLRVIASSLVVGMVALALLALWTSAVGVVVGITLSALSGGFMVAALTAYMGDQVPAEQQGILMGAFATMGDLGSMIGPLVVFALVPVFGLKSIYLLSLAVEGVGLVLVVLGARI